MPTIYLQNPSNSNQLFKFDTTGDAYMIATGNPLSEDADQNYSIASVVNYTVKQILQNAANSYPVAGSVVFNTLQSSIVSAVSSSAFLTPSGGFVAPRPPRLYQLNPTTFAAIVEPGGLLIAGSTYVEQVVSNPTTLEYSVIRNNNPAFVQGFRNYVDSIDIPTISTGTYQSARASAMSQVMGSGGGFGNANLFFVVVNRTTKYGNFSKGAYGLPKYSGGEGFELYQKNGDLNTGISSYSLIAQFCDKNCSNDTWLTDVYVDTTGGEPVFYFPNGGTTTRGQQYYINVVSKYGLEIK